jgi:crotonobetainyl-CoA:carnitine CoA-transferase CaiB-like acyl-CoA transferase
VDAVQAIIKRNENGEVKDVKQAMLETALLTHGYLYRKNLGTGRKTAVRNPATLKKNMEELLKNQAFVSHRRPSYTALVLTLQQAIDSTHLFGGQGPMLQGSTVFFDLRDGSETWNW